MARQMAIRKTAKTEDGQTKTTRKTRNYNMIHATQTPFMAIQMAKEMAIQMAKPIIYIILIEIYI